MLAKKFRTMSSDANPGPENGFLQPNVHRSRRATSSSACAPARRRRRRRCFNATYICGTALRLRVTRTQVFGDFTTTKVSSVSLVLEAKLLTQKRCL